MRRYKKSSRSRYEPYDTLKARIRIERHRTGAKFVWTIRSVDGKKMAQGEEFSLQSAYKQAYMAVSGLRLWLPYARGAVIPHHTRRTFRFTTEGH